jgi:hypothetical protein
MIVLKEYKEMVYYTLRSNENGTKSNRDYTGYCNCDWFTHNLSSTQEQEKEEEIKTNDTIHSSIDNDMSFSKRKNKRSRNYRGNSQLLSHN